MTRAEALAAVQGDGEVNFELIDMVFHAFGLEATSVWHDTEVYVHPRFPKCGRFVARDDGLHVLTETQRRVVLSMLHCITIHEQTPP